VHDPAPDDGPAAVLLGLRGSELETSAEPFRPALVEVVVGTDLIAGRIAEIRSVVDRALRAAPQVLRLRLEEIQRFDAAGIGFLLRVHELARQSGAGLVCTCAPRQLVAVLRRTRLDRVLAVTHLPHLAPGSPTAGKGSRSRSPEHPGRHPTTARAAPQHAMPEGAW
jgi:anti-anti-sigma regulatory factor